MAGHSQFKNIMHRKGAQDAKRAKIFTKLIREITVAAKINPDMEANPRLRLAISAARAANMPKDNIERAIKKGAGGDDGADYQEIRYEGYGPGGAAVIVETLTDNRNRTAPEMRAAFNKFGGSLGESNSVSFQFDHVGCITFPADVVSHEHLFEAALEAGADDLVTEEDTHLIYTNPNDLHTVREALTEKFGDATSAKLVWKPQSLTPLADQHAESFMKLMGVLEDNDDVQMVYSNADIDPDLLDSLS